MKKNKRITGIIVAMLLVTMTMLAGCGSQPSTLEEYINSDSEAKESIEAMSSEESGLEVTVEDNTIIYTYTYGATLSSSMLDTVAAEMEKTIDNTAPTFTTMADVLEEKSGIDEIKVKLIYLNGDGTEIFSKEY